MSNLSNFNILLSVSLNSVVRALDHMLMIIFDYKQKEMEILKALHFKNYKLG